MIKLAWLIDDNEIDNFINKKTILNSKFAEVVKDFNSVRAVEEHLLTISKNDTTLIPDYIFLDLNMPVLTGLDFLKRNETKMLELNSNIKVAVLTSSINPNDEYITSMFSSFDAYINKPLSASSLMHLNLPKD